MQSTCQPICPFRHDRLERARFHHTSQMHPVISVRSPCCPSTGQCVVKWDLPRSTKAITVYWLSLLGGSESEVWVELPETGELHRAILETYPKEHSAGYHGQAMIDLAIRMRSRIDDLSRIRDITIHTKELTHLVMGSGAGDPEKWDPRATRETLDHSAMYIFTVALQDGSWHHVTSYTPERTGRKDTVSLWRQVRTVSDPFWTQEFEQPAPLDKAHGARAIITLDDGSILEDELRVANAHPRGHSPWDYGEYRDKFLKLVDGIVPDDESYRFLDRVQGMVDRNLTDSVDLSINAGIGLERTHTIGLLSSETP